MAAKTESSTNLNLQESTRNRTHTNPVSGAPQRDGGSELPDVSEPRKSGPILTDPKPVPNR
jgi:hypothetical protein